MPSFQGTGYGLSSQFTVKATAKKMAKSMVGKSMARWWVRVAPALALSTRRERPLPV